MCRVNPHARSPCLAADLPHDANAAFNTAFFQSAWSILGDLMPEAGELADLIRVVDVARAARGRLAQIVADAVYQGAS